MWLEIIENSRTQESRSRNQLSLANIGGKMMPSPSNRAGMYGSQHSYNNDIYSNQEDEPLDNYLDVQDADAVTLEKSYGVPNDYYYTGIYI
jgi:hypothetical protein